MDTEKKGRTLDATRVTLVHWKDAVADVGWDDNIKSELHDCTSIGFIIDETKDALTLANTVSQDQSNCRINIPKKWILKRKVVAVKIYNYRQLLGRS